MMESAAARLALGTAQFGLVYGVANRTGQVSHHSAASILSSARHAGVDTLDTAVAYGNSEQVLGDIGVDGWRIVTKLPALPAATDNIKAWVSEVFASSLRRLRVSRVHGLLLHQPGDLLSADGERLYSAMQELKAAGLLNAIGVSIYDPAELERFEGRFRFDLVQAPFNLVDRRIERSGWLQRLKNAGVEVHTRSAFLQGLLLMQEDQRPEYFRRWRSLWAALHGWLSASGISALQACLSFALSRPGIDRVVVGVDTPAHLDEMLRAARGEPLSIPEELFNEDPDLVNPSKWPKR